MTNNQADDSIFPKFAIGIPTLNRWDLLRPTLAVYTSNFPNTMIYVLDNGNQVKDLQHDRVVFVNSDHNLGVATSWNELCRHIFKMGNAFSVIVNDDITLRENQYTIGNYLYYTQGPLFKALGDWCAFAIPKATFDRVGPFDGNFMAYYEDMDYEYRMKLAGLSCIRAHWLSPSVYRNNGTGDRDPSIYRYAEQGLQYYIRKWGGKPGQEKFTVPFDGK